MIIKDENGNTADFTFWGSEEKARKSLKTLKGCSYCSNCWRCSNCSNCSHCSNCSDCTYCSDCSDCSYCSDCSVCSNCSYCSDCSDCSYCSDCSVCLNCYDCSYCSGCAKYSSLSSKSSDTLEIPIIPDIHKRVYEAITRPGNTLDMWMWHSCNTTHCRAGWVVHLAGEKGYAIEKATSPVFAAAQIYKASGYRINPARFYDDDEDAMKDIRRLAEIPDECEVY